MQSRQAQSRQPSGIKVHPRRTSNFHHRRTSNFRPDPNFRNRGRTPGGMQFHRSFLRRGHALLPGFSRAGEFQQQFRRSRVRGNVPGMCPDKTGALRLNAVLVGFPITGKYHSTAVPSQSCSGERAGNVPGQNRSAPIKCCAGRFSYYGKIPFHSKSIFGRRVCGHVKINRRRLLPLFYRIAYRRIIYMPTGKEPAACRAFY